MRLCSRGRCQVEQVVVGDVASEFFLRCGGGDMTPGPDSMRPASSS